MKCSECKFTKLDYNHLGEASDVYALCTIELPRWADASSNLDRRVQILEYATDSCDLGIAKGRE